MRLLFAFALGIVTGVVAGLWGVWYQGGAPARKVWDAAMADPGFVEAMRQGEADFAAGRTFRFREVRAGQCGARLGDGVWCQEPRGHVDHWPEPESGWRDPYPDELSSWSGA
jgi:hypothetical protein